MQAQLHQFVQTAERQRAESAYGRATLSDEVAEDLRALGYLE
jgi:hypothetical protein